MSSFVHLHTHSYFSFLDGVPSPGELAAAAANCGMGALALTDRLGLTGSIEFYDACRERGVRPLLGLELPVCPPQGWLEARPGSLVVLAQDLRGWSSLCRLSTALLTDPERDPSRGLPFEQMAADAAGLVCLTGGRLGLATRLVAQSQPAAAARWLDHLHSVFGDRLYVELAPAWLDAEELNSRLADLAGRQRVPTVATGDVYTLNPDQAELQRLLAAIRLTIPLDGLGADLPAPPGSHFVDQAEMARRHAATPGAVERTAEVAARCAPELPLGIPHYPEPPLPAGRTVLAELRQRAEAGARRRYGSLTPAVQARLDHELGVIGDRGYAPLFLIMEAVLRHARDTGVPTSSRGSAASSLVAYCLEITSPDPLRLDLYFERFLNPARASAPDIDTDLCSRRRDGVIRYVYDSYGDERVAMVCTVNRFRGRSALREAAKAFGIPGPEVTALTEAVEYRGWGPPRPGGAPASPSEFGPYAALAENYPNRRHQHLFRMAARMLGMPHHLSVHPGGVVIASGALTDLVPCQLSGKGMVTTQFDLDSVARLGLVKIDLLGIRGLTVLGDMAEFLARTDTPDVVTSRSGPLARLEAIPSADSDTEALLQAGRTIGCFQIESPGMRAVLREISAKSVDDLMVALALYRPGPLTGGLKDAFVRRHLGKEPVQHLHPALGPLLEDTHGVILYQEQVLRIAHGLGGLTLAEADLLRRAMSHFDPGKQMQTLKDRFIAGAEARNGVPPEQAERIWELMAAFAGYGFPKAHAASYALVAWRAAWCKAHYPAEFLAAVLANWGGYYPQRVYLNEARRWDLRLRPPHINHSLSEFSVAEPDGQKSLYMGLNQVRDLTQRTLQRILRERPFHSQADFLARADPRPGEAANLVRVGALEGLGTIPALLRQLTSGGPPPGQLALFEAEPNPGGDKDWPLAQKLKAQEDLLGTAVDAHPLELFADRLQKGGALTTVAAAGRLGQRVRVAGMRQTWRRAPTAHGEHIYFMALEDLDGMLDVVIFPDVYRRHRRAWSGSGPYVIEGQLELDPGRGEPVIRAEHIWRLE